MASITNQQLFALYREEKGSNALSQLPEGFDESLEQKISELGIKSREDPSALKELENARKLVISIVQLRRQKIMLRSITSEDEKITGANSREQEFYERVQKVCLEQDRWLNEVIRVKPLQAKDLPKKVKIIQDVPQYTASDGKAYGPFKIGDEVELPSAEADWMVKGKLAGYTEASQGNGSAAQNSDPNVVYVTKALRLKKVKIDEDVPVYENPDGHSFGPFKKGEEVSLPEPEARYLARTKLGIVLD